jgi:hypothetical protein
MWSNYNVQQMEERRRNDSLRSERHEHAMRRREAELADREQLRVEREERWELEKREREAKLVYSSWRERTEIGTNLVCLVFAIVLLIAGIRSSQVVLGGSGAISLLVSVLWMLHGSLGRGRESTARRTNPPLTADG